jgi:hypothetical protein
VDGGDHGGRDYPGRRMSDILVEAVALRKEAAAKQAEADRLLKLSEKYPDLRKHVGRWNKVVFCSKSVNVQITRFDLRHNCGCCRDSPLEVWPYLETELGPVYSDPPMFHVGRADPCFGGDLPSQGWDATMRAAGLPESIVGAVGMHFKRCAREVQEAAAEIYGEGEP